MGSGTNREVNNCYYFRVSGLKQGSTDVWFDVLKSDAPKNSTPDKKKFVSGTLQRIEPKEYTTKDGKPGRSVKITIVDKEADEMYIVDFGWTGLFRNILNSIASSPIFEKIHISLYMNKKGYASVGVQLDGKKTEWKYPIKELNAMNTIVKDPDTGEVLKTKTDKQDKFLTDNVIIPLQKQLGGGDNKSEFLEGIPSAKESSINQEDDDMPF